MKLKKLRILSSLITVTLSFVLAGCGGSDAHSAHTAEESLTPDRSITVTTDDRMLFSMTRIEATAGEVLSLTLEHTGRMPKFSMGHNIVILQAGEDGQAYCRAAERSAPPEFLPAELQHTVVASTKMLGGGESDTIVFRVPSEPGEYPFVCSFPGHYRANMHGVLVVR